MAGYVVIGIVSGALVVGAAWGLYGRMSSKVAGFILALAGGALIEALMLEMVEPATRVAPIWLAMGALAAGATVFSALDYLVDERWTTAGGAGLLIAITLDGVPENLALGVSMIGGAGHNIGALAGAILLSNLPEAAGGARQMREGGMARPMVLALWIGAAVLLAAAALLGRSVFGAADPTTIAAIRCFAAGAVVASLATEVFPRAFRDDHHWAGVAVALGLILAMILR